MAGIDLRLVQAVSLAGGPSALPGEKEIQEDDEKTSTDEQEARAFDRLRTVIAYFFCHVRHGVQQSIQRQTDLNHFRPALSAAWNENLQLFVWTTTVESIQTKRARGRQTLEQIQPG